MTLLEVGLAASSPLKNVRTSSPKNMFYLSENVLELKLYTKAL